MQLKNVVKYPRINQSVGRYSVQRELYFCQIEFETHCMSKIKLRCYIMSCMLVPTSYHFILCFTYLGTNDFTSKDHKYLYSLGSDINCSVFERYPLRRLHPDPLPCSDCRFRTSLLYYRLSLSDVRSSTETD